MTDKERILTTIIRELYSSFLFLSVNPQRDFRVQEPRDISHVYFDIHANRQALKRGDLVLCASDNGNHDWVVSYLVKPLYDSFEGWQLREIGTSRLCNMTNNSFIPIRGLRPSQLWEGEEYEFSVKVLKAFARGDEYLYRYGGLEFGENQTALIWIREAFGGMKADQESIPFSLEMKWNKKTSIAAILRAMREAGYGTRAFEYEDRKVNTTD
jgi:hypothetical protein